MKTEQLLKELDTAAVCGLLPEEITGVCYDSRKVQPGNLFVAVTGFSVDGHRFIEAAVAAGAACVVCERPPETEIPYILVSSSRLALAQLAAAWYGHPTRSMKMIGITGTNGKTTVTYLLKSILEETLGVKVGLIGTIQNMIGDRVLETERTTPESLELQKLFREMRDAGCTYVVMEVSSHSLVLDRVATVSFDVGVFTNLTQDHLDFHKTMEAYCAAKAMLFPRCRSAVINIDDAYAGKMTGAAAQCALLTCSEQDKDASLLARDIRLQPDSTEFSLCMTGETLPVSVGIPGRFTVYNAMSVLGTTQALGIPFAAAVTALRHAKGVKGRVEVVPTPGKNYTILIDYAHTPDALENVLLSVREYTAGKLIVLFGCGGDRDATKRPIMGRIAAQCADFAVVTSDNPRTEDPNEIIRQIFAGMAGAEDRMHVEEDRPTAIRWAMDYAEAGDVIVLAGKGHETYQIRGTEKYHLDEREVVADYLQRGKTP